MIDRRATLFTYVGAGVRGLAGLGYENVSRVIRLLVLSSIALLAADATTELLAEASKAKIIGLGATNCEQFNIDIRANPLIRRDYLAWAQGFMSGILLSRPPGVDEDLDLNPAAFGLIDQLRFLEDHCRKNTAQDFSDAVEALYKRLRNVGKT